MPRELAEPWRSFLAEVDARVEHEVGLHCCGGFIVTTVYGLARTTADLDVLAIVPSDQQGRFTGAERIRWARFTCCGRITSSAGFLSMLAHDSMPTTFVLYAQYRYQWTARDVGLVLGAVGVAALIVQGGLVGRIVAAVGERRSLAAGFVCGALGMAIGGLAPTGRQFLAALPFVA